MTQQMLARDANGRLSDVLEACVQSLIVCRHYLSFHHICVSLNKQLYLVYGLVNNFFM
jgi:hypothetical protein